VTWSAQQYAEFEDERTRPARDLIAALPPMDARQAIDLGCGPGNSTEALRARFPEANLSGIDSSADMIAAAKKRLPRVAFQVADIEDWNERGPFDVILANAVFHWLPNHGRLFPAVAARLAPSGALAVQMPDNLDIPAQRLMREVAADGPWAAQLASAGEVRTPIAAASWYYELLKGTCARVDVWRTTYHHALSGAGAIVEWFKGSGLRPFLDPLDAPTRAAYLERYTAAVAQAYPAMADGTVLLPFPRLFIVAVR
jgi:trans-aconitate 2-methyltransferase